MQKLKRYKDFNSYDLGKCLALTAMFIDHIGMFFLPDLAILRVIGRISFPMFFFLIGYSQKFKNNLDIIILALLMIAFDYFFDDRQKTIFITSYTVLPTIIISRLILKYSIDWVAQHLLASFFFLALYMLPISLFLQCGTLGCAFMIYGYLIKNNIYNGTSKTFLILTVISYFYFQHSIDSSVEPIILIVLLGYLSLWMNKFKLKEYQFQNNCAKLILSTCSRYSLLLYYVHFELFKIMSKIYKFT